MSAVVSKNITKLRPFKTPPPLKPPAPRPKPWILPDVIETQNPPRDKAHSNEPYAYQKMKDDLYELFTKHWPKIAMQQPYIDRAIRGVRPLMVHGIPIKHYGTPTVQGTSPHYINRGSGTSKQGSPMPLYDQRNLAHTLALNIRPFPLSVDRDERQWHPVLSMESPQFQYQDQPLLDWQPYRNRSLQFATPLSPTSRSFAGTYRPSIRCIKRMLPHEGLNKWSD